MILTFALYFALGCISISFILMILAIMKGPTLLDRIVVSDVLGVLLLALIVLLSMLFNSTTYLALVLLIALISFIGSVALAKFVEKGRVIDYDNSNHSDHH